MTYKTPFSWVWTVPNSIRYLIVVLFCILTAAGDRVRPTAWSPKIKRPKTEPSLSSHKNRDLSLPALVGEPEKFKVNAYIWNLGIEESFLEDMIENMLAVMQTCVVSLEIKET